MTESSTSSTPPGREPASGHPDVPSQSVGGDPQDRDTAEDIAPGEHGEIEQAPGPIEGERSGASDIAGQDDDKDGGVDDDEPTPGDAPADPVDEGDASTQEPNESGEPEPGEMDPTQLG